MLKYEPTIVSITGIRSFGDLCCPRVGAEVIVKKLSSRHEDGGGEVMWECENENEGERVKEKDHMGNKYLGMRG